MEKFLTRAPAAAAAATSATSAVTRKLRAVSFNVDGLDDLELQARTFEVCSILAAPTAGLSSAPDIIMLQELEHVRPDGTHTPMPLITRGSNRN